MDNPWQTNNSEPQQMRANRKVLETTCSICRGGFQLAEQVYECPSCAGYHHISCWDNVRQCSPASQMPAGVSPTTEMVMPPAATAEAPVSAPALPETVSQSASVPLAADERKCPDCRQVIKRDALKCRHCGSVLTSELADQEIPPAIAAAINSEANGALVCAVIGLFICPPILGWMAISRGRDALGQLSEYPDHMRPSSIRTKAIAAIVMGCIVLGLFVLVIFGRLGS